MIQAVIFDRDGVLTDFDMAGAGKLLLALLPISDLSELAPRWRAFGREHGFPRSLAEERAFWPRFWDAQATHYGLDDGARAQLHQFNYAYHFKPYPDARPALLEAKRRGLKTAVLSNFVLASLEASLEGAGLRDLVDLACSAMVIGASKPDPAAYRYVTDELGVAPEQCLFFDDQEPCVQGARACGWQAYQVDRGVQSHDLPGGVVRDLGALVDLVSGTHVAQQNTLSMQGDRNGQQTL